ncbi:MAG: carboxypeptidase regulatory-like domain-containing protein, partial [Myxococcales bacterium]|nr:carboxypeptidase regulatory-like domain-containing protein [Myxococcales bacterium]
MRAPWLLLPLPLLFACGEKEATDDTDDSQVEADADADTDSDTDTDVVEANASLSGTILDVSGAPVQGARVSMCKQVCRTVTTGSDGVYAFDALEPWTHAFEVVMTAGDDWSTPLVPLTLEDSEARELDAVALEF